MAGFAFLNTLQFLDYQGDKTIAWKSLPLSMLVTQRGLLYAIPAGLLLLWNWRDKFFRNTATRPPGFLPFWIELTLYASMPLFHFHTFLALTIVLLGLFVCGDPQMRGQIVTLLASAFLPATFFVWLITDHFHAGSVIGWHPGWVMLDPDFRRSPPLLFWWDNFGIFIPRSSVVCVARTGHGKAKSASGKSSRKYCLSVPDRHFDLALLVQLLRGSGTISVAALPGCCRYGRSLLIGRSHRVAVCIAVRFPVLSAYSAALPSARFQAPLAVKSTPLENRSRCSTTMRFALPDYNHPLLQGKTFCFSGHALDSGFRLCPSE